MRSFLGQAWFVCRFDLVTMLRQKETILWTFLMPPVFFYFIGTVTGGFGPSPGGAADPLVVRRGDDAGFLAERIERRLAEQDYEITLEEPAEGAPARALEIPAGFTVSVLAGETTPVVLRRRGAGLATQLDRFRVSRAVYTTLADLLAADALDPDRGPAELGPADLERVDALPRALVLEVKPAGERRTIPTGFEQTIPGTMVMFTMLILLTTGATSMVIERKQGLLRRLASAPLAHGAVVAGKWGGKLALGLVQIAFAMVLGTISVGGIGFGIDWGDRLPMVLVVLFAYASFMASLGMLLGIVARTEGQAIGLGVLGANVFGALGGCWWPIEVTPESMQKLALFLPTGWAMDALHKLVNFGLPSASALPHAAGMLFGALLLGAVSTRWFRFE